MRKRHFGKVDKKENRFTVNCHVHGIESSSTRSIIDAVVLSVGRSFITIRILNHKNSYNIGDIRTVKKQFFIAENIDSQFILKGV